MSFVFVEVSFAKPKAYGGKAVGRKEGQLFRPSTEKVHFLKIFIIRDMRIPGSLLLIPSSCCKILLGVAHSPLVPRSLGLISFRAGGWQAAESSTALMFLIPERFRTARQWPFSCQDFVGSQQVTG